MIYRLALYFAPELWNVLKWIMVAILAMILMVAPMIGLFSQAWAPWWLQGNTQAEPGVVPLPAVQAPQGPLLADATPLIAAIQPYMGVRYLFGGNDTRGIDCSGLVVQVARAMGWSMPHRTAQTQFNATARVTTPQFGDLVFFERTYASPDRVTHVGWYVGDGMMISAIEPTVGRQSLSSPFWSSHFVGYGRILR